MDGVFNYDNRVMISIPLLKMVRKALQSHTAIFRMAETVEEQLGGIDPLIFEHAYLAFEAMIVSFIQLQLCFMWKPPQDFSVWPDQESSIPVQRITP